MRIEPEHVRAVVEQLCEWNPEVRKLVDEFVMSDLINEFDVVEEAPPADKNALGPFARDSDTSREAAKDNFPRSGTQRYRVLIAVFASGDRGMTRDEISEELELTESSTHARVWELAGKNGGEELIKASNMQRRTRNGSMAEVMVVTKAGVTAIKKVEKIHV